MTNLHTEEVGCGVCGSQQAAILFTENYTLRRATVKLGICRCQGCDLVYVSPRLTPDSTSLVYQFDAEHTISHNYCWDGSASEQRFAPLLRRLRELASPGRLLDIGCGGGHFLSAAKRTGKWEPIGVEPVASAASAASEFTSCEVHALPLEEADLQPESFQVVSLLGVLEHLHDPVEMLNDVRKLLAPDGVLAAYVPNFDYLRWKDTGILTRLRTGRQSKLHPQEHLFQYTPRTFRKLLAVGGFEVVRMDVGRPFLNGNPAKRALKESAYFGIRTLYAMTGIHLGGIEIIARPKSAATPTASRSEFDRKDAA